MARRERKNNLFKHLPAPRVRRNLFDLSHEVKMSGKFGYLYPILCMDTLPGDTIRDTMSAMIRFAPMLAPVMHRCDVTTHFFFVPNRIICDVWEEFITGGQDGLSTVVLPYVTPASVVQGWTGNPAVMQKGSVWDYLGLPVHEGGAPAGGYSQQQISVLPFRALAKAWNDYYRDPNLEDEIELNTELEGDVGLQTGTTEMMSMSKYRRGFEKDYFTSALPYAQRGAQVLMPLAGTASVDYLPTSEVWNTDGSPASASGGLNVLIQDEYLQGPDGGMRIENIDEVNIDGGSTTINDFRRALAIQRWLEANARGGGRYVEQIFGHFAERVPDYRLQRAEYLGGGKQPVSISEVLTTAQNEADSVYVGDMAGHGLSVGRTNRFTYRCQEHGFVVGFLSVTMRTAYSQGIPKMFMKSDKFEFAWPELANLGEQEISSKELFFSYDEADTEDNDALFGYIPRYSEYKFQNDRIAGDFRDNLGFWHLGRNFTSRPSLDVNFTTIFEDGDGQEETFRRIFAVSNTDYLWMQLYHTLTAKRPLPYFGVPQII